MLNFVKNRLWLCFILYTCGVLRVQGAGLWPFGYGYTDDRILDGMTNDPFVIYKDGVKAVRFPLEKDIDLFGKKTSQLKVCIHSIIKYKMTND